MKFSKDHNFFALLSVFFLSVYIGSCFLPEVEEPPLPKDYPTRVAIDTRRFSPISFNDSLELIIVNAYYKAFPNELGLCIYGHYVGDEVVAVGLHADSTITGFGYVRIFCPEDYNGYSVIGDVHSHPRADNPAYPCMLSQQDYFSLLASNYAASVVYCGNGSGVMTFRDGRWWNFAWR